MLVLACEYRRARRESQKVKIEGPNWIHLDDAVLTREAADRIFERNRLSGQVDLLNNRNYEQVEARP